MVLLDMILPDLDGVDVVRRLRAAGVRVPVVLSLQAISARRASAGSIQGSCRGMLQKPFDTSQLLAALDQARFGRAEL